MAGRKLRIPLRTAAVLIPVLAAAGITIAVGAASGGPAPATAVSAATATAPLALATAQDGAEAYDNSLCADCHEEKVESLAGTTHSVLGSEEWAGAAHAGACTSCHGDPTAHLDSGGEAGNIFAFSGDDTAAVKTQACQSCHQTQHPRFEAGAHAAAGLGCTSCHGIHGEASEATPDPAWISTTSSPNRRGGTATCVGCHGDVAAMFELNERHRLREGILDCTSCHNPHEPQQRLALGGFKQDQCGDCHRDKTGPFVFEHGSQRVEGCVACHTPHGSVNRHMLRFQRVAEACYSCHGAVPGFHSRFTLDTVCTNCHSSIHGSNFHEAFLK